VTAKKRGRPAAPPVDPDEEERPAEAVEPDDESLPWEAELDEWQAAERIEESQLNVVLYRLRDGKSKERVWKWVDEIPDEHDIGLRFGGGIYMVYAVLSAPGGFRKVKHRRFTLAASYDAERARAHREQGLSLPGPAGVSLAGPTRDPFDMMLLMMEKIIVPVMAGRGAASAPADLSHWNQANEIVGRVVQSSAEAQLRMSREVGGMIARNGAGPEPAEAEDGDFKDYLKDMIKEYGPTLLEAAGLKLKAAAGLVKRDEVFTQLSQNKELFGRVLNLLAKDPDLDPALTEKVLTKLQGIGVAIPLPPGFVFRKPAVNGAVASP
jgi:hypothetical protein